MATQKRLNVTKEIRMFKNNKLYFSPQKIIPGVLVLELGVPT
jgi:hypothetical protein